MDNKSTVSYNVNGASKCPFTGGALKKKRR